MAIYPVTRVTVGDSLGLGTASIKNKSDGLLPLSIKPPAISSPLVTVPGLLLDFNMTASNLVTTGLSVRFTFSGAIVQPSITLGSQQYFGLAKATTTDSLSPYGFQSHVAGVSFVSTSDSGLYNFDFFIESDAADGKNIAFHFGPIVISGASAGDNASVSTPTLVNALNIRPNGLSPSSKAISNHLIYSLSYNAGMLDIDLSSTTTNNYNRFNFGGASPIAGVSAGNQGVVSIPVIDTGADSIAPLSILPPVIVPPLVYEKDSNQLRVNTGVLDIYFSELLKPSNAQNIGFYFWLYGQADTYGFQSSEFGVALVTNAIGMAEAVSWVSAAFGEHSIQSLRSDLFPVGIAATSNVSIPALSNSAYSLNPIGIISNDFGAPSAYNLKQFLLAQGKDQSLYGTPFMGGGVKTVLVAGVLSELAGAPVVINTTGDQRLLPLGMTPTSQPPIPQVKPYIVHPAGIYEGRVSNNSIVDFAPTISPRGIQQPLLSAPTIWYHTREVSPYGVDTFSPGYSKVFDPTQYVVPNAFVRSTVFGDTYAKNNRFYLKSQSIDSMAVSQWLTLTNKSKPISPKGFVSQSFGYQEIKNKSPSIWFEGINPPVFNAPAIAARVRSIAPSGFDRLLIGQPSLTKTPDLKPYGFQSHVAGALVITHAVRFIKHNGSNYLTVASPTIWFRYRKLSPQSWLSSVLASPVVTHGVREVIANGFNQQQYGTHWVSQGTRTVQAQSAYTEQLSRHMVGGTMYVKPDGYIATLFGTRITPLSRTVEPLGFAGSFGLTEVLFSTQYIKAIGYLSAGVQPADRWGKASAYNKTQYITNYYQGDSGLVPPPWSNWTLIESRNKTIGVTGLPSLRFGYSQIDNKAAPLVPPGISPPVSNGSMVSHAVRTIPTEGIYSLLMSAWAIAYNGARVIAPNGDKHTTVGHASTNNTRRYYRNVGRLESLETGTPMIAGRIRTIDIEKRYSIGPPIIRLPTIDLLTKHVEVAGYEATGYSLPSLVERFNVIAPRWAHRDKGGNPTLRNVTPELLTKGRDVSVFGQTAVRTQWRVVDARGHESAALGLTKVADTKQVLSVRGFLSTVSSQLHTVIKLGTNDYVTQNVWLNDENNDNKGEGFGIYFDESLLGDRLPKPSLNQNVLYPKSIDSLSMSNPAVRSNNITVDGGIAIQGVSKNANIFNKTMYLSLNEPVSNGIDNKIAVGEPRLSPWTIYAVKEAPYQAQLNHTPRQLHYVGETDSYPAGERFGSVGVEGKIRVLSPRWLNNGDQLDHVGRPSLELWVRVLKPEPFRLTRYGIPSIPFSPKGIKDTGKIFSTQWGSTLIAPAAYTGPMTINVVKGIDSFQTGEHQSDNLNRVIFADGSDSLYMGKSIKDDQPFMWQGLRIGPLVPFIAGGVDTSIFGNTTIGLRVRGVSAHGFNAFISEYDITNFGGKMTVSNNYVETTPIKNIKTTGFSGSNFGSNDIKLGQHFIRPDGNSVQFRKGGYHA